MIRAMTRQKPDFENLNLPLLIDSIPALIHTALPDGNLDYFNRPWLEYVGVPMSALLGWGWTSAIHPADLDGLVAYWRECFTIGRPFNHESRVRRADGEYRWFLCHGVPLRDDEGKVVKWYGVLTDIEDRKRAEDKLRQSEAYRTEAEKLTHTGSWALDLATDTYVYVSDEDLRIWGFDPKEGLPSREVVFARIHPEDRNRWKEKFEGALRAKVDSSDEYRIVLPGGTVKHIHTIRHPVLNAAGDLIELVGTTIDITERKHAERGIRRSEEQLRNVIETIPAMAWTTLPDGSNIFANRRWAEYTGLSPEETAGSGWLSALHPRDREPYLEKFRVSLATGELFECEARFRCAAHGQHRWFLSRALPLRNEEGGIVKWYGIVTDIEDRKRAEQTLRQSEAYLAEAQRLTHTGSWALDLASNKYVYVSKENFQIYGFDPKEAAPDKDAVFRRIHPEDRNRWKENFERSLREKADTFDEYRIVLPDGAVKHIQTTRHPVLNDSGEVVQLVGTSVDVTEHKQAAEALRESERKYHELVEHANSIILHWQRDGRILHLNEFGQRFFGYTEPEIRGRHVIGTIVPETESSGRDLCTLIDEICANPSAFEQNVNQNQRRNGELVWIAWTNKVVLGPEGEVTEILSVGLDITARKRMEEELRLMHFSLEHASDAVYWMDPQGRIVFVNKAACRLLNRPEAEVLSLSIPDIDPHYSAELWRSAWEEIRARGSITLETCHRSKEGRIFPVEVTSNHLEFNGKEYAFAFARDITERKRAENERERLRQLEADLAHINRVSMLGELAASIAHEVNQPLSGIVSNGSACLRFLAGDSPNVEEAREAAHDIVRDGKRAGEIIARIRALTKRAVTPREKLDLNDTIRDVLALVVDKANKNSVSIQVRFANDLAPVSGDRVQLQQVVLNLVMNAVEAMSNVTERPRELVITTRNVDPDQVQVTVEDSGPGLDPGTAAKIFDPFYTTKPGGMGMGLSISRSILQAHGGRLWATAKDGPGTCFHFSLPRFQKEEIHAGV